jgi:hypothetical protein
MKNVILQHYTGNLGRLEELSIKNISQYAKDIGADYKFLSGQVFNERLTPPCQKIIMLDQQFDVYDNVLMLDIDMFVTMNTSINVFDVPGIGLYEEIQQRLHESMSRLPMCSMDYPYWGGAIYKMDLNTRKHLRSGLCGPEDYYVMDYPYQYEDEGIMHILACKTKFNSKTNYLTGRKWCYCSYLPEPESAGFIHVRTKITPTGPKQSKLENLYSLVKRNIINV